ncbi:MAG: hypothetical protein K2H83_00105 [Duncaniella sp.]|nr:hypothetical protein [Duncaniella sp.]
MTRIYDFKKILLMLSALAPVQILAAQVPSEADAIAAEARKAPRNRALQLKAGKALSEEGRFAEAIPFFLKGPAEGNLGAAEASFYLYDFDNADTYLERYTEKRTREQEAADRNFSWLPSGEATDWTEYLSGRIEMGRSMLDRVEKIQVIDSVNIPLDAVARYIRLSGGAGSVASPDEVGRIVSDETLGSLGLDDITGTAFVTESGNEIMWTGTDPSGLSAMYESYRLADGTWDTPRKLFSYESIFGSQDGATVTSPFLMSDGVTLYFAADGAESLGGLDLFVSRRDDDRFLQPSNLGMPYNSPYNDYLYAVDEETGAGFWVSDRNQIPDTVTLYTFVPSELRVNYPTDIPGLTSYARLASIKDTQDPAKDYAPLRRRLASLAQGAPKGRRNTGYDFTFALPDGRIAHRLSDLRAPLARKAMEEYLDARRRLGSMQDELASLRARYAGGDRSVSDAILSLEQKTEALRASLTDLSNAVVTAEH